MPGAGQILDVASAVFGGLLRREGVSASPAEVIEVRRVLGLIGARDHVVLRAALRATCAKYSHEQPSFDRAFDVMFRLPTQVADGVLAPVGSSARAAAGLPDDLHISEDQEIGKYAEYNERAAEVGEYFDTDDASKGFNPHKDDDDISVSGADADLSVSADNDSGRRGVTYTLEVDRAGTTAVGALSDSTVPIVSGSLHWDDPASILAWLDAYDPNSTYADLAGDDLLTAGQLARLTAAVEAFVEALAAATPAATSAPNPTTETDLHADVDLACHEVLRRMRGARRPRPRERGRGVLDMRRTARAGLRTDGVPFRLIMKTPVPDRVRLLVLADVSLSVRPVTAFTLRLAQAMHRRADRCRVMAFVDRPTEVTEVLLRGGGDSALASVLAGEHLDLEASSDYGRMLDEMLTMQTDALDSRTAVLIVGDARSGGLPPKVEQLQALRRRVHRLAWITPEPQRYWTQATCAMHEYAQVCDRVIVARDAEQLAGKARELADALS